MAKRKTHYHVKDIDKKDSGRENTEYSKVHKFIYVGVDTQPKIALIL